MRRILFLSLSGFAVCVLFSTAVIAARNLAEYPLRVHIFQFNGYSHYYHGGGYGGITSLDVVDGEGRANLYENGEPRGFDFRYRCGERLRGNPGYETYPAKWKKQGKELEILLPQFGKPDSFDPCDLVVLMKDSVYFRHNGLTGEEPAAKFKEWMVKHQYDPEKGKNEPVAAPEPAAAGAPGANAPK